MIVLNILKIYQNSPEVAARVKSGQLWETLLKYDASNYIMTLSTPGVDTFTEGGGKPGGAEGLIPGHAYTLIGVHEVQKAGVSHKLCQIRNPWGSLEWTGDWSDESPLWTPELKAELSVKDADDGLFWMSYEDMLSHFTGNVTESLYFYIRLLKWIIFNIIQVSMFVLSVILD
jgi:hypothetical protein